MLAEVGKLRLRLPHSNFWHPVANPKDTWKDTWRVTADLKRISGMVRLACVGLLQRRTSNSFASASALSNTTSAAIMMRYFLSAIANVRSACRLQNQHVWSAMGSIYGVETASAQTLCRPQLQIKIFANSLISLDQKYVIRNITFLLETATWLLTSSLSVLRKNSSRCKFNKRSKGYYHEEDRNFPPRPGRPFNGFVRLNP